MSLRHSKFVYCVPDIWPTDGWGCAVLLAMETPGKKLRRSYHKDITVRDIMEVIDTWLLRRGTRDMWQLLKFCNGHTWKTGVVVEVLADLSDLFREAFCLAPNTLLPPARLEEALRQCDNENKLNFTEPLMETDDFCEKVGLVLRRVAAKYRDLFDYPNLYERAMRRASALQRKKIDQVLSIVKNGAAKDTLSRSSSMDSITTGQDVHLLEDGPACHTPRQARVVKLDEDGFPCDITGKPCVSNREVASDPRPCVSFETPPPKCPQTQLAIMNSPCKSHMNFDQHGELEALIKAYEVPTLTGKAGGQSKAAINANLAVGTVPASKKGQAVSAKLNKIEKGGTETVRGNRQHGGAPVVTTSGKNKNGVGKTRKRTRKATGSRRDDRPLADYPNARKSRAYTKAKREALDAGKTQHQALLAARAAYKSTA